MDAATMEAVFEDRICELGGCDGIGGEGDGV